MSNKSPNDQFFGFMAADSREPLVRTDEILWSQEEAVAFECARECITDMMAIYTGKIAEEEANPQPDRQQIELMRAERSRLARERAELRLNDHAHVARIMDEYGAAVRAWRTEHLVPLAHAQSGSPDERTSRPRSNR